MDQGTVDEIKKHFDGVSAALRLELRESTEETRRHFGVVAEALRSDVRGVAAGLALLTQRVDGVQSDLAGFKQEVRREFEDTRGTIRLSYFGAGSSVAGR